MEGSLFIVTALLIGRLGEVPAAAHQIAINVAALCFMVPDRAWPRRPPCASAMRWARGDRRTACAARRLAGYVLVLGTQALSGMVLLLGHDHAGRARTRATPAVAALAGTLLLYAAAFQFPDGIQVLSAGALRGLKDTRVPMVLAALAYWGIGMPLGAGLGPAGWAGGRRACGSA